MSGVWCFVYEALQVARLCRRPTGLLGPVLGTTTLEPVASHKFCLVPQQLLYCCTVYSSHVPSLWCCGSSCAIHLHI